MRHAWNFGLGLAALTVGALAVSVDVRSPSTPLLVAVELEAPVPMQEWTADAGVVLPVVRAVLAGRLPAIAPGQKAAASCDPDLGERPLNGGCWMATEVPTPCPAKKLWEHEGRCWRPVPRTAKTPTSGDPGPSGVANP